LPEQQQGNRSLAVTGLAGQRVNETTLQRAVNDVVGRLASQPD